jgi:[ribosomal protein S18]-alanine N-acetyltransferase
MVRRMKEADVLSVESLLAVCPEAAQWSPAALLHDSSGISCLLVRETQGSVLGFIALRIVAGEAEILNLAVAPECRQQGIGRVLLEAGLKCAQEDGVQKVFLEVRHSNVAARGLYASLGFTKEGCRSNYYSDPVEDALVLSRVLS